MNGEGDWFILMLAKDVVCTAHIRLFQLALLIRLLVVAVHIAEALGCSGAWSIAALSKSL